LNASVVRFTTNEFYELDYESFKTKHKPCVTDAIDYEVSL